MTVMITKVMRIVSNHDAVCDVGDNPHNLLIMVMSDEVLMRKRPTNAAKRYFPGTPSRNLLPGHLGTPALHFS